MFEGVCSFVCFLGSEEGLRPWSSERPRKANGKWHSGGKPPLLLLAACCLLLLLLLLPLAMHGEARMHAVAPVDTWCPQCLCTMSYVVTTATTDQTASEQLGLCTAVLFWSVGMECPERTCYPLGHYSAEQAHAPTHPHHFASP